MTEMFSIPGPAGALQAKLTGFDAAAEAIAILCHPHPLYGGSMDDLVLTAVAEALAAQHVAIVRFNFRGVGASAGSHSGQGGEVDDLRAVLNWLQHEHPDVRIILAGYSFGASVVARILRSVQADLARVLLVAPPLGNLPVPIPDGTIPVDVFVGDKDDFCDRDTLAEWSEVHIIEGADHFFGGRSEELIDQIRKSVPR